MVGETVPLLLERSRLSVPEVQRFRQEQLQRHKNILKTDNISPNNDHGS